MGVPARPDGIENGANAMTARFGAALGRLAGRLGRPKAAPIDSAETLAAFLGAQAAHVAQRALYGYLRTRMGQRWADIFQDPAFAAALADARTAAFLACLSDLTIFAVASAAGPGAASGTKARAASVCFDRVAGAVLGDDAPALAGALAGFARRAGTEDWDRMAIRGAACHQSTGGVLAAAPVADACKAADREIVQNSVRFAWPPVRRALRRRLMPDRLWPALCAEIAAQNQPGDASA